MKETNLPIQGRRYDIDWLRNAAIVLLFPFHTARVFDYWDPFYAKNGELSWGLSYFIAFASIWFMPLLFWLAGSSSWFALGSRTGKAYIQERALRLGVPLLAGVLLIVPPQGYYALLTLGEEPGSYFRYLGSFFTDLSDLSGYTGGFRPAHLWFILYLFVFSLLLLPVFKRLRADKAHPALDKLAAVFSHPIAYLLLSLPLSASKLLPAPGGQNPFYFAALFLIGYVAVSDQRYQTMFNRYWKAAATLAVLMTAGWIASLKHSWLPEEAMEVALNMILLLAIAGLLGLSHTCLNRKNKLLSYMNEAAFPIYIIHQTVIIVIAYYAVQWQLSIWLSFPIILILSLTVSVAVYETILRRIPLVRFLMGIKRRA